MEETKRIATMVDWLFAPEWLTLDCMFRPMPTIDSDGCRPLVPSHAGHLFRQHGVHFFGNTGIGGRHCSDSVDGMLRNLGEHH